MSPLPVALLLKKVLYCGRDMLPNKFCAGILPSQRVHVPTRQRLSTFDGVNDTAVYSLSPCEKRADVTCVIASPPSFASKLQLIFGCGDYYLFVLLGLFVVHCCVLLCAYVRF